jgi:exodeoxyribonuclease VII large subunit
LDDLQIIQGVDVIILARGGGSLEDLAPFNTEGVARAIARSRIPVISAIGHETDFTIADFTADLRAATPSAAAELAVPLRAELMETLQTLRLRMNRHRRQEAERLRERIAKLSERLRDPKRRLADIRIALDDNIDRMRMTLSHLREVRRQELINLIVRLEHRNPRSRIVQWFQDIDHLGKKLRAARERQDQQWKNRVRSSMSLLESLSPLSVLNRGYSITRRLPDGLILRDAREVSTGQEVDIRLSSGNLHAKITEILHETFMTVSGHQR